MNFDASPAEVVATVAQCHRVLDQFDTDWTLATFAEVWFVVFEPGLGNGLLLYMNRNRD